MDWPWPPEVTFFLGAAAAQWLLACALLVRHNRQEWAWALAVAFAFNGTVALARGMLLGTPSHVPLCVPSCGQLAGIHMLWLEPVTISLLAYAFLTYPERPAWVHRNLWLMRALALGPILLHWGFIVFARGFVWPSEPSGDWRDFARLYLVAMQSAGWCAVLLFGAWALPRIASPLRQRQFGLLYGVVGMRAAHIGLLQVMGSLDITLSSDLVFSGRWLAGWGLGFAFLSAPVVALGIAVVMLVRARPALPATHVRSVSVALSLLVAGMVLAFLPGPGGLFAGPAWYRVLTHYDLYVLRPAVVWLAIVQPRFPSLASGLGAWGTALPASYAAIGAYVAALSSFSATAKGIVFLYALGIAAALASALLVAFLARSLASPGGGAEPPDARHRSRNVERYADALEAAWRHSGPDPGGKRLVRLRRKLGVSPDQHDALLRALQGGWAGPPAGTEWQPGDLLASRYEVVTLLGQGGSGEAYHCRDILAGRDVVLKRTHLDAAGRRALAVENAALGSLSSSRIVRCRRAETVAGATVLVLDFMPGGSLQTRLSRQGRLAPRDVRSLGLDLLEALDVAHAAGIVHGDVKPSNILFDGEGRAVLADFGAARAVPGAVDLSDATQASPPTGSLRYMAPEQVRGLPADPRTDLYALAVVLCEAATGVHPLRARASDLDLRQAIARGGLRLPAGLPSGLRDALREALSVDPAKRPPSARSMARRLREAVPSAQARNRRRLRPTPTTSPA